MVGFNTQPHGGGCISSPSSNMPSIWFQHTAARRRLRAEKYNWRNLISVSTHSRTEAAAFDQFPRLFHC